MCVLKGSLMCGSLLEIARIGPLINPNCLSNLTPQSGAAHFHSKSLMPAEMWEKVNTWGNFLSGSLVSLKWSRRLLGLWDSAGPLRDTLTNHLIPTQRVINSCCFNKVPHYYTLTAKAGSKKKAVNIIRDLLSSEEKFTLLQIISLCGCFFVCSETSLDNRWISQQHKSHTLMPPLCQK